MDGGNRFQKLPARGLLLTGLYHGPNDGFKTTENPAHRSKGRGEQRETTNEEKL